MSVDADRVASEMWRRVLETDDAGEEFERIIRRVYEAVLQPGDVAFDAGAHVGKHSLPMLMAVAPAGTVVALEPIPWAAERLRGRARGASVDAQLVIDDRALGSDLPSVDFSMVGDRPGISSIRPREGAVVTESRRVETTTIDALADDHGPPRFIKLDIEGAEADAIAGADTVLSSSRPVVHVEASSEALRAFGHDIDVLRSRLTAHGYVVFDLLGIDVTEPQRWAERASLGRDLDYIAVHADDPEIEVVRSVLGRTFRAQREAAGGWRLFDATSWKIRPGGSDSPDGFASDDQGVAIPPRAEGALDQPVSWYWPTPTRAVPRLSTALLPAGCVFIDLGTNRVESLDKPVEVPLPCRGTMRGLGPGWSVAVDLAAPRDTGRTETLLEVWWPSIDLSAVVRTHRDRRLECIWFRGEERLALDRTALLLGQRYQLRLMHDGVTRLDLVAVNLAGGLATASLELTDDLPDDAEVAFGCRITGRSVDPVVADVCRLAARMTDSDAENRALAANLGLRKSVRRTERLGGRAVRRVRRGRRS